MNDNITKRSTLFVVACAAFLAGCASTSPTRDSCSSRARR
jgi:uncharacterized lipoprotein YajG